jgi:hypothetical protein
MAWDLEERRPKSTRESYFTNAPFVDQAGKK